jgi:hypothetical protein
MVTDEQMYILVGVPMLFNATLIGLVIAYINARIGKVESKFESKFDGVNSRFDGVNQRFDAIDRRFDDMRDLWRAELRRVEEVLDARLKHIEERG